MLTNDEYQLLGSEQRLHYDSLAPDKKAQFAGVWRAANSSQGFSRPHSSMLGIGMAGSIICALGAAVLLFSDRLIFGSLLFGACSLFALMWMLGSIEERLIEINETLKARSTSQSEPER